MTVLYVAAAFFILAMICSVLGFGGMTEPTAGVAKVLFFAFLVSSVVTLLMGVFRTDVK